MLIDDTNLKKVQKEALIISFSFIFSLVIYAGLVEFVLKDLSLFDKSSVPSILRYILMAVSAVEVFMMVIIKNRVLSGETKLNIQVSPQSKESAQQSDVNEESSEAKELDFINRLRSAHIITYALCESIAIYGLILFILAKDKTEFYAFLGVSLFLMFVHFPKYDDWKSRLEDFLSDF
jgi:hypothetical protein